MTTIIYIVSFATSESSHVESKANALYFRPGTCSALLLKIFDTSRGGLLYNVDVQLAANVNGQQ